ncbi:MAG: hypothetical protein ACRC0X_06915, partial [Brevinema sp.]
MKYVLIILLFISSCADNKEQEVEIFTEKITPELFWFDKYNLYDIIDNPQYSSAIFYEPILKEFYFATIEKTNNIIYDITYIIPEHAVISHITCWEAQP